MARSRLSATLAVAVALAIPATALAASAGDNQYSDPFGGNKPSTSQPQTNTTPSAPAPTPAASQAQSTAAPASNTTNSSGELPRTGLDLRLFGGIGVLLVVSGLLLRRLNARP